MKTKLKVQKKLKRPKNTRKTKNKTGPLFIIGLLLVSSVAFARLGYRLLSVLTVVSAIMVAFFHFPIFDATLLMMGSVIIGVLAQFFETLHFYILNQTQQPN